MRVAAAQTTSRPGGPAANIDTHLRFAQAAADAGVNVLVFPELSLTGYDLPALEHWARAPEDQAFAPLREAARRHGMSLVVGTPAPAERPGGRPGIGAITFRADGGTQVYRKRHLHPGEEAHAEAGTEDAQVQDFSGLPVAMAVCADIGHAVHADAAARAGAALYAAGVVVSDGGHAHDTACAQGHARRCGMAVLLANHGAPTGGYACVGRSAFWAPDGALLAEAPGTGDWLVVAERSPSGWTAHARPVAP
ncbi:carbon-nitrogen hydrolase family protein [Acidovorax sp. PRC11]|uniref:carbon-nitrogen hydrolase family protein n=1 Tax=Acidovorax sp. PRC11 TaxID=2962592 RepID=UPI0028822B83|nr:carbon-nitrogen hydrolase family protein [Acidovorax sp. PRC11]MDT0136892.1 carbon-nitrogen hydrolase family protein [Acidovorax sp. PRC11]